MELEKMKQTVLLAAKRERAKVSEQRPSVMMKMEIWKRKGGGNPNERYLFRIAGKEFEAEDCSISSVWKVSRMLTECCKELNGKRGYLVHEIRTPFYYQGRDVFGYITLSETITSGLVFLMKPCKEFRELQRYLLRHAGFRLFELDLYYVNVVGKRGTNYEESGERCYHAHNSSLCKKILTWLGKNRKSGDKVEVTICEERVCDDEDYSREYETESYGVFHRFLKIRISDKNGKERATHETNFIFG